ncbi:Uncharacterised protein [Vibrio cholerae]|uniref:Uncharacterized protein n=1 Tax=Vibrio cholerae TaxID=666 RepID=A0A655SN36_VIBCL|nr:Uncharacterised protein [Vibrio cholerae]CSB24581.1 Uncharacterised protein [Vibrio cholerae]CSB69896.1 Uncharacterised protein [Vibrio cholerae]CSC41005.1 Uncharacterised protein [Vibrio cholerae]CSC43165.1 Uncharacterised protein [Vibrio cholerae]
MRDASVECVFSILSSYRSQCLFRDSCNYKDLPHYNPRNKLRRGAHDLSSAIFYCADLGWQLDCQ